MNLARRGIIAKTSRGAASLAAARSQAARGGKSGSMSRADQVGVVFMNDDHVRIVEFVRWA